MILIKNISDINQIVFSKDKNNSDIKNILFPGETISVENFMTNSMRALERRGSVAIKDSSVDTVDSSVDVNNDEAIDNLHTTKDVKVNVVIKQSEINNLNHHNISQASLNNEVIEIAKENNSEDKNVDVKVTIIDDVSSVKEKEIEPVKELTGRWKKDEVDYLKRVYPKKGSKYIAEKLNRPLKSVQKKVERLKLKRNYNQ